MIFRDSHFALRPVFDDFRLTLRPVFDEPYLALRLVFDAFSIVLVVFLSPLMAISSGESSRPRPDCLLTASKVTWLLCQEMVRV